MSRTLSERLQSKAAEIEWDQPIAFAGLLTEADERIAELETACRLLGAELWWFNQHHSDHDEICAAKAARKANATANGFVAMPIE